MFATFHKIGPLLWQARGMPPMNRDEAWAFLAEGTRTGKLATSLRDVPHVAPVWFVLDGDDLVFTTGEGTVKGRALRANPYAALVVDDEAFPFGFVLVRGPVHLQADAPDLLAWTTRIASRYVPAERTAWYGERNAVPGELLCRLRVEHLVAERDIAL
jgi:PPOX class probable F420-dependent enzyme